MLRLENRKGSVAKEKGWMDSILSVVVTLPIELRQTGAGHVSNLLTFAGWLYLVLNVAVQTSL